MKPSDIKLSGPVALAGCFGRVEREQAAAMMVSTLAFLEDEWRPVWPKEIGAWMTSAMEGKLPDWMNVGPFFNPSIDELIEHGYARWVGPDEDGRKRPVEFTEKGLQRLQRWEQSRRRKMLVLTRKPGEAIMLGDDIKITILELRSGDQVRIGIDAPKNVPIAREEVYGKPCRDPIKCSACGATPAEVVNGKAWCEDCWRER